MAILYSWSVAICLTIVFWAITVIVGPFDLLFKKRRLARGQLGAGGLWVKTNYFKAILRFHGVKVVVSGPGVEAAKNLRGVIYVANHQSVLDIPAISEAISQNSAFLAKKELRRIPLFGWCADVVGTQFIDRAQGSRSSSLNEINSLIQRGVSVILFPEGTRSSDGQLGSFKRGAFVMAIENQTSVIPLVIYDSLKLCPKHAFFIRPGTIRIFVENPVSARGLHVEDRVRFSEEIRSLIAKDLAHRPQ